MDHRQLWDGALTEIELAISKPAFVTWFKDTHIVKREENTIVLSVPNAFARELFLDRYHTTILKLLRDRDHTIHAVEYVINKEEPKRKEGRDDKFFGMSSLPLPEMAVNKEDNLNPRYTFETFIIGPFNELAHAAAQAVLKKPGIMYNPLFIYGSTGHGKTHLIQAIGNHIKTQSPSKRVYYMTSEKFGQDCMNALQTQKMSVFKDKYRKYDVLIMDDIQFFSEKQKFQEELFHLFNSLYDNNKQVIFSSDKHPHFISGLEDRLKSRMSAGMIVDIPAPDQESRTAILEAKAKSQGLTLSAEVIDYLSRVVVGNIRDLEGVLQTKKKKNSIQEESIYEKTRRKEIIKPRQVIMYILREDFSISYPSIGDKLGGRDHTTVIHSCEKIKEDLKQDQVLSQEITQIRNLLAV
ncbi:chromosomal replication initiator protein DnaA [Candidatus Parcubacteria bacterium]|nr:chromosomal replication initiator protein DnaA [Candidatus Parcubacteria bacterium]